MIERMSAGWGIEELARVADMYPSSIRRAESGETMPTFAILVGAGLALGLRLEWVPQHLRPLLTLSEHEVRALQNASVLAYESEPQDSFLASALVKLGGVQQEGDSNDRDGR